jgi:anti-sigma-K factor RskA
MTRTTGPDHERWEDAAGAYLLGALAPDEAEAYAAHLADCATCRAEVDELEPAAALLPASVAPVAVPAAVGARVMAEVRREAELLAASGAGADRAPAPRARRARLRWRVPALALATLLVGLAIGLGATGVLSGSKTTTVQMAATGAATGAHAKLVLAGDRATLEADHLPAPSGGRVYQVWLKPRGGAPEPTRSLFVPRSDGRATVAVPAAAKDMEAVLVTAEPGGGSRAPTSPPVLSGSMSRSGA